MASINFNPFGGNWFSKPPNPLPPPLNTLFTFSEPFSSPSKFASTTLSDNNKKPKQNDVVSEDEEPGPFTKMVQQFFYECENIPDHRHTPEVEKVLNEDPVFEVKENATEEEKNENEEFMKSLKNDPVVEFLLRADEIADKMNEMELKENEKPHHREDRELWKELPHVPGLDGRPLPRKAIKSKLQADVAFWDFARQFFFGLWGYRQRPYPPCKPNDAAQAIGYKNLERRYYDFIMRSGGWYYKDRLGRTRGPLELITLKTAWGAGIIDKNTFIWGDDMDEWVPIHMIYGMERAVATWEGMSMRVIMVNQATSCGFKELVNKFIPEIIGIEIEKATAGIYPLQNVFIRKVKILKAPKFDLGKLMEVHGDYSEDIGTKVDRPAYETMVECRGTHRSFRLAASATAFLHKLQKGIPPWVPVKGFEKKTYKQLQEEAIESKRRDLAVLEANDGVWPGVRIPSHALFLWASGSELTTILEEDHMPNKYIPKDLRMKLAKLIPGLRPWEVLSIEQAMDRITFHGQWYRVPLGSYTTGPPYVKRWNVDIMKYYELFDGLHHILVRKLKRRLPGFNKVLQKVWEDFNTRIDRLKLKKKKEAKKIQIK